MTSVKKQITRESDILNLHSLDVDARHKSIEDLSLIGGSDTARQLIQIYNESFWRDTKLHIIACLANCLTERGFEFLTEIVNSSDDLILAERALVSLGKSNLDGARLFLRHSYFSGRENLKISTVKAIVACFDRSMSDSFYTDLQQSLKTNSLSLSQILIYALGEFKYSPLRSTLQEVLKLANQAELWPSALTAFGKISRDPSEIKPFEQQCHKNVLLWQTYEVVLNQISLRSYLKAEDYLEKIFSKHKKYHPSAPYELNTFLEEDVNAGLELYSEEHKDQQHVFLDILSKLNLNIAYPWYKAFKEKHLTTDKMNDIFFRSLKFHHKSELKNKEDVKAFSSFIEDFKIDHPVNWVSILIHCEAESLPNHFISYTSLNYSNMLTENKLSLIGELSLYFSTHKRIKEKHPRFVGHIEELFLKEKDPIVQARWVRFFAHVDFDVKSVSDFITENIFNETFSGSLFYFLERKTNKNTFLFLEQIFKNEVFTKKYRIKILKLLSHQVVEVLARKEVLEFLNHVVKSYSTDEAYLVSKCLCVYSNSEFSNFLFKCLEDGEVQLKVTCLVALRKFDTEVVADKVGVYLQNSHESVQGRALDCLLTFKNLRSKRLIVDFLENHLDSSGVIQIISRRFEVPDKSAEYFCGRLNQILNKVLNQKTLSENEAEIFSLTELRDRLFQQYNAFELQNSSLENKKSEDVVKLDSILGEKIFEYKKYDEVVKSALRSAELPITYPEMYGQFIDKSVSILEYSKALDIHIERSIGKHFLKSKLELKLYEFQNIIQQLELADENITAERMLKNLDLESDYNIQSLPRHKIMLLSQSILNAKILNEQFKVLDGLRAWAVVLLLFGRKTNRVSKPLLNLNANSSSVVQLSKKLILLQDLRNPAAHREVMSDFKGLESIREQAFAAFNLLDKLTVKQG